MEEARRILARLERIEALDREQALPGVLLEELRALLGEAEAWARIERDVPQTTVDTVDHCRKLLKGASRTLLA